MKIHNNIYCTHLPVINFGNKVKSIGKIHQSRPTTFLDIYAKENNNSYTKNLIKDLRELISSKKIPIKESDIKNVIGRGGLSTIFDLGNNEILKCSLENPLEFRPHNPTFDIPFLSQVEKFGQTYFVKEVKADTENITIADCKSVINRIYNEGFEPSKDLDIYRSWQIGKYKDKPYLLDTRAAVPRPNQFSEYIYNCCNDYKRVFQVKSWTAEDIIKDEKETAERVKKEGLKALHIDETPRKNLDFKEGIKMVREVVVENIKYGQWSKLQSYLIMFDTFINGFIYKLLDKVKP